MRSLSHVIIGLVLLGVAPVSVQASLEPSFIRQRSQPIDINKFFTDSTRSGRWIGDADSVRNQDLTTALLDREDRISHQFRIPPGMKKRVQFWLKVYTLYTTQHVVLYDRENPDVVYDVLDLRELRKKTTSDVRYEGIRRYRIAKRMNEIRTAMRHLQKRKRSRDPLSRKIKRLTRRLRRGRGRIGYQDLASRLRAQTGQRDNVASGIRASRPYMKMMEKLFAKMNVPTELTRLSLVESSFNINAISKAGATGVWQFMLTSGREYMHVEPEQGIDERLSPLKATVAAARLLGRNYRKTGNWPLAVTSYNQGLRGILRIPRNQRRFGNLARIFGDTSNSHIGFAGRNYYAEFLALLRAEKYQELFFGELSDRETARLSFVRLVQESTLADVAMKQGASLRDLLRMNPDIREPQAKLPEGFLVVVPGRLAKLRELISAVNYRHLSQRI